MDNNEKKGQMHIDKMIRRELISLIVSTVLILLIFIGISFASFFSSSESSTNTIDFGDIELTMCTDSTCEEGFGKVIGTTEDIGGNVVPSKIYPYESDTLALESDPYIFKVENTGDLDLLVDAYLNDDTTFTPSGAYESYGNAATNYAEFIKIGINECPNGIVTTAGTSIYTYSSLTDGRILENDSLGVGESKTYCLWTWLSNTTPNSIQANYFVANLRLSGEYLPVSPNWYENCLGNTAKLGCKMLATNNERSDSSINFSRNSNGSYLDNESLEPIEGTLNSNGQGLYYTSNLSKTENNKRVYYYRGEVENNYVIFANYCWRIVRSNENNSIKLRFGGTPTEGVCPQTGTSVGITFANNLFNVAGSSHKYVGYMFGISCSNGNLSTSNCYNNENSSTIKINLETWYSTNISNQGTSVTNLIVDTPFCYDRNVSTIADDTVYYAGFTRLIDKDISWDWNNNPNAAPQFKCDRALDKLSVTDGTLTYPIGLLTSDEAAYAGTLPFLPNENNYLNTSDWYWIGTPLTATDTSAQVYAIYTDGRVSFDDVATATDNVGMPVISISYEATVSSGNGTYSTPFVIDTTN